MKPPRDEEAMARSKEAVASQMWYHPENGSYVICHSNDEVPDGFVASLDEVEDPVLEPRTGPAPCTDFTVASKSKEAAPKKAAPKKVAPKKVAPKKVAPKKVAAVTLENLDLTREEAEEILGQENIKFSDKMLDDELAHLVAPLLED